MLNRKLINVKNILKIIISCLVIFSMLKSCSMAYNIDDLYEYSMQIKNMQNVPSQVSYCADRIINNYWQLKNVEVLKNAKSILVQDGASSTDIYYWNDTYKISFNSNGTALWGLPTTSIVFMPNGTSNIRYLDNQNFTQSPQKSIGLLDLSLNTQDEIDHFPWNNYNWYLNNKYDEPSHFLYTPYNITTIDDYNILKFTYTGNVGLGLLGENDFYQLQVRLKDSSLTTLGTAYFNENQECYYRDNALIVEDNTRIFANTVYLSYYEPYYLEFTIYSDSTNYEIQGHLYKFYPPNAVIENGQIVSPGSGDYTNQDATIQNQNFITNLYNNMFKFSGDYIEEKLEKLKEDNILPSGDAELEKAFIDLINNNNGDFRIAWGNFTPNLSVKNTSVNFEKPFIESGEVNFSKLERENPKIQEIMTWTRTILGFTLGALLLKNLWRTFISMLGIGYSIYNTDNDEKEIANKGGKK